MLINYVPGEECRVAIVEDGKLEELYVERFTAASRVGNIYVGKVVNVEPAIQAAFIDFGVGENAFLHISDLHPKYFPGEDDETTERVGFKTPRRERPPIQRALKRGDEVIVQVLKEGVGTKGPTVTSYLSIPGRFLVMMPGMDKVGVSRKVEDEEQRREMREILDQLELPEGFGFILRTAGMSRTKAELKRDLAYLQRLWKDMERRLNAGGRARLLYSESDLLVRALRDILTNEIQEVIVDHEIALKRSSRFMKIVAPRGATKLLHFPSKAPLFHAFGIEQQIALIHAREVPLPSGGRLVIDQTEALVAIDVNSGKSRDSRNSEDNAYQTNLEAVDEICRQLRLRDMGGIVINDLIDMRHASHRKDIETRFKERLKRDRAKSTITPISEFGILEMTRQRMRPSHESVHFLDCPICRGRGVLQKPDSVASDALRELAALLDFETINKVEMVVAPRVAGELLSAKRGLLNRIERAHGKHVDVRIVEGHAVDRVDFYAYDPNGADIELARLPKTRKHDQLVEWIDPETGSSDWAQNVDEEMAAKADAETAPDEFEEDNEPPHPIEIDEGGIGADPDEPRRTNVAAGPRGQEAEGDGDRRGGRRRRRRGRGGRGRGVDGPPPSGNPAAASGQAPQTQQGRPGPRQPLPAPRPQGSNQPSHDRRTIRTGDHGDEPTHNQPAGQSVSAAGSGNLPNGPQHEGFNSPDHVGGDHAAANSDGIDGQRSDGHGPESQGPDGEGLDGQGPEGQGPDGQGPNGEGGQRRRRRRRRRGRGGAGGPEGAGNPNGQAGQHFAPGESGPGADDAQLPTRTDSTPSPRNDNRADRGPIDRPERAPRDSSNAQPGFGEDRAPRDDGPDGRDGGADGGEGGEGGRRRRRRRGRRGRGGGGEGPDGRGNGGGGGGGGGRGGPPPAPKPAPQAAPQPTPKPRTLYGAVRRKLNPSELNRRPKPE
jgi:ribonuclease E